MITLKQGMKISAILDKMDLKLKTRTIGKDGKSVPVSQEELGADLIMQALAKAHRAEKEIYSLVADIRGCTIKEAQDVDLVEFIRELVADEGVRDFLGSAVASQAQE